MAGKKDYYNSEKWVFTVLLVTACSFLFYG